MNIAEVNLVYFSPTGTTKRTLEGIAEGMGIESVHHVNLTVPGMTIEAFATGPDAITIMGAPVYGGRLPKDAVERLGKISGAGSLAVPVVVYGNRAYDNALFELKSIAAERGFVPVAGGAFIGEHSFTSEESPIAVGRPDEQDIQKAMAFGEAIRKKLEAVRSPDTLTPLEVPGKLPPEGGRQLSGQSPETVTDLCDACGICAEVCPTAAITVTDIAVTDEKRCIMCCACVKNCPTEARIMNSPRIKAAAKWLSENFSRRAEPEVFL